VKVDVGLLDGRPFVNASGGGFIAEVSEAVTPRLKTIAGRLAYLLGGAQTLFSHEPFQARLQLPAAVVPPVWTDGAALREPHGAVPARWVRTGQGFELATRLQMFAVCNARLVGGGRLIAPHAIIDDGLLDVCLVGDMPPLEFVMLLRRVAAGEHVTDERVAYFRTDRLALAFDRPTKVNTDGQVFEARRCHYDVRPAAARFLAGEPAFTRQGSLLAVQP
jgi:diacylglycerol kinase (ATP)